MHMHSESLTTNPKLAKYKSAGLVPAYLPSKNEMIDLDSVPLIPDREHLSQMLAHTIPGSYNYLPPMRPAHLLYEDWLNMAGGHVRDSAYAWIADLWTSILSRKDPAAQPTMYMLWNEQVPKPNQATILWWVLMSEIWPMAAPSHILEAYLSYYSSEVHGSANLAALHPPQPIPMPMSQHASTASSKPAHPTRGPYITATHEPLGKLFGENLTRHHRDMMTNRMFDRAQVFMPNNPVTAASHVDWWDNVRPVDQGRFVVNLDSSDVCGHGLYVARECDHHWRAIERLRKTLMSQISIIPGFATTHENLWTLNGSSIRGFSEDNCYITGPIEQQTWGLGGERPQVNGKMLAATIPAIAPKVWFGFTGVGRWIPHVEEYKPHYDWMAAYFEHRPFAMRLLFEPDRVNLTAALRVQATARHNTLERAKRFRSDLRLEASTEITNVFAAFGESFRKAQQ